MFKIGIAAPPVSPELRATCVRLLASTLLAPAIAPAQSVPIDSAATSARILEEVQVGDSRWFLATAPTSAGSRLNLSILETPASIEVIDGDVIRLRGDTSIVDAVTRATGISTAANPGNGAT